MIESSLPTRLCYASRATNYKLTTLLLKEKVTPYQLMMLEVINNHPNSHIVELCKTLYMERTTMSRNMRLLLVNGWLTQLPGADKRCKRFVLTSDGVDKLNKSRAIFENFVANLQKEIGSKLYHDLSFIISKYLISKAIVKS